MLPKVSVIVPIYNVATYIEKCAQSLFMQTLDSLEIIFIDDCSPDNSLDLVKLLLEKYPCRKELTRFIKMPSNSGLAAVRREGIIQAKGDFIIHCDGDDWIDLDLYKKMYDKAIETDADIVVCNYVEEYKEFRINHDFGYLNGSPHEYLKQWYSNTTHMSCCNKLIKKSVYYNNSILPWKGLNMWEDNGVMIRLFYYGNKMVYVGDSYYHYNRLNNNAMTAGYGETQVNQMIKIAENLTSFFESKSDYQEYRNTVLALQFLAKINLVTDKFSLLKRYKNLFPESDQIIPILDIKAFSKKGRIRFYFVRYHLEWLFVLLFKLKNFMKVSPQKTSK